MPIATRSATPADNARLHELFRAAFGKEDESDLWSYLLAHDSLVDHADVCLALQDDRPAGVTVLQRRPLRSRYGWVPGAIVTLVACDPTVQRQGYGGASVQSAIERMRELGIAVGILYGIAEYYPKFGFVPVLPSCRTEVTTAVLQSLSEARLRPVTENDLPAMASLYADAYDRYPCAIRRDASPALWGLRVPAINSLMTLPDQTGYAFIRQNAEDLYIYEAAAVNAEAGRRLLAAIGHEAAARGVEKVFLSFPPDHLLNRLLGFVPSRLIQVPAKHGMAVVTDWARVLAPGYAVSEEGLLLEGRLVVRADRAVLTQLVMGYRSADDLLLMADVHVADDEATLARLRADFPPAFPKWSLDPFWEGA